MGHVRGVTMPEHVVDHKGTWAHDRQYMYVLRLGLELNETLVQLLESLVIGRDSSSERRTAFARQMPSDPHFAPLPIHCAPCLRHLGSCGWGLAWEIGDLSRVVDRGRSLLIQWRWGAGVRARRARRAHRTHGARAALSCHLLRARVSWEKRGSSRSGHPCWGPQRPLGLATALGALSFEADRLPHSVRWAGGARYHTLEVFVVADLVCGGEWPEAPLDRVWTRGGPRSQ